MASGGPGTPQPLPTVLVSACAWREAPGICREKLQLQLQLSVEPENPGDFLLAVRGPNNTVVGDFRLRDVSYEVKSPCCHQLSLLADPATSITFNFDDELVARKWWTVVSSTLREAQKAAQSQPHKVSAGHPFPLEAAAAPADLGTKATKSQPHKVSAGHPFPLEAAAAPADLGTKEELAARLSKCIESGNETLAARYAAELARQRVSAHIQLNPACYPKTEICMKVAVEDAKASVDIATYVYTHTTIAMLKQQIYRDYQFHPSIQRWIIGQCLCCDDRTVGSYGIRRDGDSAFLYLLGAKHAKIPASPELFLTGLYQPPPEDQHRAHTLPNRPTPKPVLNVLPESMDLNGHLNPSEAVAAAPPSPVQIGWSCSVCTYINVPTRPGCEMCSADRPADYVIPEGFRPGESERRRLQQESDSLQQYKKALEEERQQNFMHLIQLDNEVLIPNQMAIDCPICYNTILAGEGVLLRECLHSFCRDCLRQVVNCCEEPEVSCPYRDEMYACDSKLQEREIRALVSLVEYARFQERSLVVAESRSQNSYHCCTADCKGWCIYEDAVNDFICPICHAHNCLTCKAVHDGMNCREYQDDLRIRAQNDSAARQTNDMLRILVQTGEAMHCPRCQIIVQKKDGCDWIRCTMCHTEICWVTKGPRWGPQGPGDTSGGCRCNMNGRKCDPRCQNCH